jgi:hypothetical protein
MTAAELIALHADDNRHPKALDHELRVAHIDTLVSLAYGQYAPEPLDGVPGDLASMAYDETERRQRAINRLMADNPALAAALRARASA